MLAKHPRVQPLLTYVCSVHEFDLWCLILYTHHRPQTSNLQHNLEPQHWYTSSMMCGCFPTNWVVRNTSDKMVQASAYKQLQCWSIFWYEIMAIIWNQVVKETAKTLLWSKGKTRTKPVWHSTHIIKNPNRPLDTSSEFWRPQGRWCLPQWQVGARGGEQVGHTIVCSAIITNTYFQHTKSTHSIFFFWPTKYDHNNMRVSQLRLNEFFLNWYTIGVCSW